MVICLERDADLHMVQLMPLPLTVSCFSEIQIGFTFLVLAHLGSPGKRAVKHVLLLLLYNSVKSLNFYRPYALPDAQPTWCDYMSGARCRLFAYGPADAGGRGRGRGRGKVFPYSLTSVGPGADPGVQAVSPQAT